MIETKITNAMSVDVEDYFQVSAFENIIDRQNWDSMECRVEKNTNRILDIFSEVDLRATFFTLGWVAERFPQLVKRIADEGHEVASHGFSHKRVVQLTRDEFREEVRKTKELLEDLSGQRVNGYRAPSYSINKENLWAFDILSEVGYQYSSSIYPIHHDLYGIPDAPRFSHFYSDGKILEIPITTVELFGKKLPCGGGGYFRLLPYTVSKMAMKRVNAADKKSCIFYFHPWEIDPEQPRQKNASMKSRFRHYLNLNKMETRLKSLIRDFQWDRMDKVFIHSAN